MLGSFKYRFRLIGASSTGSHLSVHVLNIFSLDQCTLVGTKASLGEFVNALVCGRSSGLDHIQNSAFVRGQSNNLTSNFSAQKNSLSRSLNDNWLQGWWNRLETRSSYTTDRSTKRWKTIWTSATNPTHPFAVRRLNLLWSFRGDVTTVSSLCVPWTCHLDVFRLIKLIWYQRVGVIISASSWCLQAEIVIQVFVPQGK